ncbi:MAG: hypothetical protein Fur0032_14490 [Terrimicrobiaceae bacterium]
MLKDFGPEYGKKSGGGNTCAASSCPRKAGDRQKMQPTVREPEKPFGEVILFGQSPLRERGGFSEGRCGTDEASPRGGADLRLGNLLREVEFALEKNKKNLVNE